MFNPGDRVIIHGTDEDWIGAFYTSHERAKRDLTGATGKITREHRGEKKKAYMVMLDKSPSYFNDHLWFYESMLRSHCIFGVR